MEIMTREEYAEEMLKKVFIALRVEQETEERMRYIMNGTPWESIDEDEVSDDVARKAIDDLKITNGEYENLLAGGIDEAYGEYCEAQTPKDHIFNVSFSVPTFTGTVQVIAKDEDEAQEYVENNLTHNICDSDFDVYDDSKMGDDGISLDEFMDGIEVDDVEDEGEVDE